MTPEERIAQLEAELDRERASRERLEHALQDVSAVLAGRIHREDRNDARRVRPKPGVLEWAALHPGVPLPPAEPLPEGADIPPPLIRLLTPEEQAARRAERERYAAEQRAHNEAVRRERARRWVYFIQGEAGGPIKIGISRDVERRRNELQRAERQPLKVLATIEGTMKDESALHQRFAAHRLHGEWFSPAADLLTHIANLNGVKA